MHEERERERYGDAVRTIGSEKLPSMKPARHR